MSDNGRGILPELLEKIFDPYFSTKDTVTRKGLGIGRAICCSIIHKHESYISINFALEKITNVGFTPPVYE